VTREAWPEGVGLRRHEMLDSTNAEALRLAGGGERRRVWIAAAAQGAGRGRRGHQWVSRPGNLFATLLLQAPHGAPRAQLGFAAALAVADVAASYAPSARVALKWPNDVLLEGRKLAGILLETAPDDMLAIGIGINLAHFPPDTEFPATSIAAVAGAPAPSPEDALARLAPRLAAWYEIWARAGFAPVRAAWIARAFGLGLSARARAADYEEEGVFEDLDEEGALLLRRRNGAIARIAAGDIYFPL
jgi:BirA family biotin operon repressor/biotin-[acetyl-CoA-carboxylase] ligase